MRRLDRPGYVRSAAITLGISDDDTIHFMSCYQRSTTEGSDPESAVRSAMRESGRPMVTTALILALTWSWRAAVVGLVTIPLSLVATFGAIMAWNGAILADSVAAYRIPTLGISEAFNQAPLVISGALIVLFSIEHIIALLNGEEVTPAWH